MTPRHFICDICEGIFPRDGIFVVEKQHVDENFRLCINHISSLGMEVYRKHHHEKD